MYTREFAPVSLRIVSTSAGTSYSAICSKVQSHLSVSERKLPRLLPTQTSNPARQRVQGNASESSPVNQSRPEDSNPCKSRTGLDTLPGTRQMPSLMLSLV